MKKEARTRAKLIAASLSDEYKKEASLKIEKSLMSLSSFSETDEIFVYVSTHNEPATENIIKSSLAAGKRVFVPFCENGDMQAVEIKSFSQLKKGSFGVYEPPAGFQTAERKPSFTVMPCLAVSKKRQRLGHGGGYYDRYLENFGGTTVCLCFSKLVFDDIPQNETDVRPQIIITETELIK